MPGSVKSLTVTLTKDLDAGRRQEAPEPHPKGSTTLIEFLLTFLANLLLCSLFALVFF